MNKFSEAILLNCSSRGLATNLLLGAVRVDTSFRIRGVRVESDCRQRDVAILRKAIGAIPRDLLRVFILKNFCIKIFTSERFQDESAIDGISLHLSSAGYISRKQKKIVINASMGEIEDTFLHEFGHFIDIMSSTTKKLWSEENEVLTGEREKYSELKRFMGGTLSDYCLETNVEFFAWAVAQYLEGRRLSPVLVNVITSQMRQVCSKYAIIKKEVNN